MICGLVYRIGAGSLRCFYVSFDVLSVNLS
jgi:hypothetical protein